MSNHVVVMFAKAPVAGRVKTRLAEAIGPQRAADLHEAFIGDVATAIAGTSARAVLAYAGDPNHPGLAVPRGLGFELLEQPPGDLGARLDAVVRELASNSETVTVVGSDSPTLSARHLLEARRASAESPVVLGPSFDGGYYLVAVQSRWYLDTAPSGERHPLFREISWSTGDVLRQTLSRCREMSCLCHLIGFWYDVDTIEDLDLLRTHLLDYLRSTGQDVAPRTAAMLLRDENDRTDP